MAKRALSFLSSPRWTCNGCRNSQMSFKARFSTQKSLRQDMQIRAAKEIDLKDSTRQPARILPASPSYFTGTPVFNDDLLLLQSLLSRHQSIPTVASDQAPRMAWLRLSQYRSSSGEKVAASKYAQLLVLLTRLNRVHPTLRPSEIMSVLKRFQRPGAQELEKAKPIVIDRFGRAKGVGRRKESSARIDLVEGTGEILINGRNIVDAFPRIHDRESVIWPLKITERMDKYNVFARVSGGGLTGQAEAITLGLTKALLVHEPALKPFLRRAGCVTRDRRIVERKKPGRVKARKMPTWVKR